MLVIGGTFPVNGTCDTPKQWGVHNSDIGKTRGRAWEGMRILLKNIAPKKNANLHIAYDPTISNYTVPPEVISIVGGSSFGGAALTAPPTGFQDPELGVYFAQKAEIDARTPTRAIPGATGTSTPSGPRLGLAIGAIIGIAIGGAALVGFIILGACLCLRSRNSPEMAKLSSQTSSQPSKDLPKPPVAQEYLVPESRFSRSYRQKHISTQSLYSSHQLPTTPEPVELHGNHYVMEHDNFKYVKGDGLQMRQVNERDHPANRDSRYMPSPQVGSSTSPNPSGFSISTSLRSNHNRDTLGPSPISAGPLISPLERTLTRERNRRAAHDY